MGARDALAPASLAKVHLKLWGVSPVDEKKDFAWSEDACKSAEDARKIYRVYKKWRPHATGLSSISRIAICARSPGSNF